MDFESVAVGMHSALLVVMKSALLRMDPVVNLIGNDSDSDSQYKQNGEDDHGLLRNHRQHHESLVSRRRYHHCHKSAEAEHPVCIEGNGRKASHTSGYRTQQ
jgi:hypothetical protein